MSRYNLSTDFIILLSSTQILESSWICVSFIQHKIRKTVYPILSRFRKKSVIWFVRLESLPDQKVWKPTCFPEFVWWSGQQDETEVWVRVFKGTFVFRVMQGGRRLFSRTYLHFFGLTLWDYLTQGASHTKRFTLFIVLCLVSTVSMTVSWSYKGKRVFPNPRHKRLRHMNNLRKRRLGTIMLCKADISYDHCTKVVPQVTYKLYS